MRWASQISSQKVGVSEKGDLKCESRKKVREKSVGHESYQFFETQ